jgi:hypothetical protein
VEEIVAATLLYSMKTNEQILRRLILTFGVERLLAALPQDEVRRELDLVSIQEVADKLGLKYDTFRWHMSEGRIPFPSVRLLRRAYYSRQQAEAIVVEWKKRQKSHSDNEGRTEARPLDG